MNAKIKILFYFLWLLLYAQSSYAWENLVYIMRNDDPSQTAVMQRTLATLSKHTKAINLIVTQAYHVDANGIVTGALNHEIATFAQQHHIKLMPLITNSLFDTERIHLFLNNASAQTVALQTILTHCQQEHFYGVQFDFEMVNLADKTALTKFYQTAADLLHKNGFAISFAVAPALTVTPDSSAFQKRLVTNLTGAYDLQVLGNVADFITIMAYNQHEGTTTPGPTASTAWVTAVINYALQFVSPDKISLGIAVYSDYWHTGLTSTAEHARITEHSSDIGYPEAQQLLSHYHAKVHWDKLAQVNYATYEHDWLNEFIYLEDVRSFKAKLLLAKKYHLRGISIFYLGIEDPKIWNVLAVPVSVKSKHTKPKQH